MAVKSKKRTYRSKVRTAAVDETRARIVEAARTLLSDDKGTPGFSLDAVAREAGVSRLTVYNQFESKRGLLEAVFDDTARRGGLFELPSVMADPDIDSAMRRFVSVFCGFWASHGSVFPKFLAVAKLDEESAQSLKQRSERRRTVLTALVGRMGLGQGQQQTDLIDVLFALTSSQTYEMLSIRGRTPAAVEALVQRLVADAVSQQRKAGTKR